MKKGKRIVNQILKIWIFLLSIGGRRNALNFRPEFLAIPDAVPLAPIRVWRSSWRAPGKKSFSIRPGICYFRGATAWRIQDARGGMGPPQEFGCFRIASLIPGRCEGSKGYLPMYLDFFAFREKPFSLTPDPRFVFLSKNHKEAFAHLLYGVHNRTGFIALTGEVGSGKTTVLRAFLSQLDVDQYRTALIFNPCLSPPKLLQNINRELGIPNHASNSSSLLDALNLFLLQQNAEGRTVVLVIDEAQHLEAPVLEQIRLISNLETDREKLIQIILAGQPEFVQTLKREEMRQLSQRITVRFHLGPMDFQDTVHYIYHRIEVAGGRGKVIFSRRALKRIYGYSGGLPRLINAACDRTLLAGYTRDTAEIGYRMAAAGIKDLKRNTAFHAPKRRLILVPAFIGVAALLAAGVYFAGHELLDQINPAPQVGATVEPTKEDPVVNGENLSRAMTDELGKVPEAESARRAFNTLAGLWKVPPVPENARWNQFDGMEQAALDRGLVLYRFSGNLGALFRTNTPAVLQLFFPGIAGKRYLSLVGMEDEQLLVEPPVGGKRSLSFGEVEKHWSGQGFLFWKDSLILLGKVWPGAKGGQVKRLQGLLQEAGAYAGPLNGVYDGETVSAVKKFQSSKGIERDGVAGVQTLMLLYRSIDRFEVPKLAAGRK
jgi:general secretion pathway protein A